MSTATKVKPTPVDGDAGENWSVDYDDLVAPDDNVRDTLTDIDDLAESILQVGLLQPLTVEQRDDGKFVITSGFRRHAAIGKLIKRKLWQGGVACHQRTWASQDQRLIAMLIENLQRVDLDPVEEAFGIQRLVVEHGIDVAEAARRLNRSEAHVKERVALCALPDTLLAYVRNGKLKLGVAALLAAAPQALIDRFEKSVKASKSIPYTLANEQQFRSELTQWKRDEKVKEYRKIVADAGIKKSAHNSYNTPANLSRATTTVTTAKQLRGLLDAISDTTKAEVTIEGHYGGGISVTIWTPKSEEDLAKVDQAQAERDARNAEFHAQEKARILAKMPDDDARQWYEKALDVEQAIAANRDATTAALEEAKYPFIAAMTAKDFAAAIITQGAIDFADQLFAARANAGSYDKQRRERFLKAMGWEESLSPEMLAASTRDQLRSMCTASAKVQVRAATAHHVLGYNNPFAAAIRDSVQLPDTPAMPPLPESLKPYFDADNVDYDEDVIGDIVYRVSEGITVAEEYGDEDPDDDGDGDDDAGDGE